MVQNINIYSSMRYLYCTNYAIYLCQIIDCCLQHCIDYSYAKFWKVLKELFLNYETDKIHHHWLNNFTSKQNMLIVVLNFNKIYSEFNSTLGLLCTFKNRKNMQTQNLI